MQRSARLVGVFTVCLLALNSCASRQPAPAPAPPDPIVATPEEMALTAGELATMTASSARLSGKAFKPACEIPFGDIAEVRDIDNTCSEDGAGSAASVLQNRAKNNFCAEGPPVTFNRQLGNRLNTAVDNLEDFNWGSPTRLPKDRSPLKDLITVSGRKVGEGSLVRTVAYFMKANFSNTSKGENVNCKETGRANNDIHIYLSFTPEEDDVCESLNAEITPHFRPAAWESVVGLKIDPRRPLRVTGQLMLDASHRQCEGSKRASPGRFTSWEIHPVYNLEVCRFKSVGNCRIGADSAWIPFHEWVGEDEHDDGGLMPRSSAEM